MEGLTKYYGEKDLLPQFWMLRMLIQYQILDFMLQIEYVEILKTKIPILLIADCMIKRDILLQVASLLVFLGFLAWHFNQ
jgi:hypothetical protein